MDPNSAQAMNDNTKVQKDLDNMQRGETTDAFELGADFNLDKFNLENIQGVSKGVRDEIIAVLGETDATNLTSLKLDYVAKVDSEGGISVDEDRRKEIGKDLIRTHLDDAVMDSRVLNALLGEDKEVLDTLNSALKDDISLPFDFGKRPDVAIFVRTLFFAVKPMGGDYKLARLAAIRSIGSLPDNKAIDAAKREISVLNRRSTETNSVKMYFDTPAYKSKISELDTKEEAVSDMYAEIRALPAGVRSRASIEKDISLVRSEKDSIDLEVKMKKKPSQGELTALSLRLKNANNDLKNLEAELKNRELLDLRPAKEKAHRTMMSEMCENLHKVELQNPVFFRALDPFHVVRNMTRLLNRMSTVRTTTTVIGLEDNQIIATSKAMDTWFNEALNIHGKTASRLEHIQVATDHNVTVVEGEVEEKKADLAKLMKNKGKETSLSDRDFNVGLHTNLAQQEPELAKVPPKDLESAIKLNILSDVLDLKENGHIGKSFNADRRSILEDIKPADRMRFNELRGVAYYDKKNVRHAPLLAYSLSTTDADTLYADIASNKLPFPSAVFLYAALNLSNQAEHPNAQLLRRQIITHLLKKFGDDETAVKNFKIYVTQAQDALTKAEAKGSGNSSVSRSSEFFAKWAERRARVAQVAAGETSMLEDLTKRSEEKGGLSVAGALGNMVKHATIRAVPYTLNFGRDVGGYAIKNAAQATMGAAKLGGSLIVHLPGEALRATGRTLSRLFHPVELVSNVVSGAVTGVLHPVNSLKRLAHREGQDLAQYKEFKTGKDLKETAAEYAKKQEEKAKKWTFLSKTYHYEMPNEYDWMNFAWGDTIDKSNVVAGEAAKPANDNSSTSLMPKPLNQII